ncbi:uncharacterized protein LOC135834876 [Planococcus citri]|uniref:uncharacterized protein LOC135834876 n=1 Tax=Planococcus citri TaxID=170843 RepID=UPI0031F83010
MWQVYLYVYILTALIWTPVTQSRPSPYDPDDTSLANLLPSQSQGEGQGQGKQFEAFYPREAYGVKNGAARPSHGHGSYYKFRNPALVDAKNSPAYGYRFDGGRRFNFDE